MSDLPQFFNAVQVLNWNYGKGDLKDIQFVRNENGSSIYRAIAMKQYGQFTFKVRLTGNTVFALGHQKRMGVR